MKYMIFASKEEAIAYSKAEAERRGCTGDVTQYWWSWIVHEDGRAALVGVGEDTLDETWFPDPDLV